MFKKYIDCNTRAQQFGIQKSQEKYIEFLSQLHIEQQDQNSKIKNLKDYLLQKHADIYQSFVQNKMNSQQKFSSMKTHHHKRKSLDLQQIQETKETIDQEVIETLKVSFISQNKQKKTFFKVDIHKLFMSEPFLVLCLEDISFYQKMKKLENNFSQNKDLILETIHFILGKLASIEKTINTESILKQVTQIQIALLAFIQKIRPIQISEFSFQEIIDKIQIIYSHLNFQIEEGISNLKMNSDKSFILQTLLSLISAVGSENILFLQIEKVQDEFCEKLVFNIQSNKVDENIQEHTQKSLFGMKINSKINLMCWEYIQNIMKQICLKDKPQISMNDTQQIKIQIEYIIDVTILTQNRQTQSISKNSKKSNTHKIYSEYSIHKNSVSFINSIYPSPISKNIVNLSDSNKQFEILLTPLQKFYDTHNNLLSLK